jgi:hypothetical protein
MDIARAGRRRKRGKKAQIPTHVIHAPCTGAVSSSRRVFAASRGLWHDEKKSKNHRLLRMTGTGSDALIDSSLYCTLREEKSARREEIVLSAA